MITGKTRVFCLIAHPVHHVRTPQALNALFAERGEDAVLVALDVEPSGLEGFVSGFRGSANFGGFVVTVPHKSAAAALCDRLSERATLAGAVNCIRSEADGTLTGELLDGVGFVNGLKAAGHSVAGRKVYLVGAGGAASAIAMAVAEETPTRLTLVNRSPEKAAALAHRIRDRFPGLSVTVGGEIGAHDLVINGTSLGLHEGDALPVDPEELTAGTLVAEVIMQPATTALLQAASARGCLTHTGYAMLQAQLNQMAAFLLDGSSHA